MFPKQALESHAAVIGKTGSGKTYAARGLAEGLLEAGARVCIVDPTGAWHGLRSSADGKRAGFPVTIFGGSHGDLPLEAGHGEAIAEVLGTSNTPAILDTSQMRLRDRTKFFAEFADGLMRKNQGPLHLFIDEAHVFAPQGKVPDPASGIMLAAANNLVSGGRSRGLRIVLITQRPAKLHKDSLTQVETLVAMRLIAPQDRKAVEEWIKDNADQAKGAEIIQSLAALKTGHGWVWAPELGILERITFQKNRTFDSSSAPQSGAAGEGPKFAAVDRETIAGKLKSAGADALANDPAELRRELAQAHAALEEADSHAAGVPRETVEDLSHAARMTGFAEGLRFAWRWVRRQLDYAQREIEPWVSGKLEDLEERHRTVIQEAGGTDSFAGQMRVALDQEHDGRLVVEVPEDLGHLLERSGARRLPDPAPARSPVRRAVKTEAQAPAGDLPKGEAVVLRALIQFPKGLERSQLTVLTGYKRSTRDLNLQKLAQRGLVEGAPGGAVMATAAGRRHLPDAAPLPRGRALREHWMTRLPHGEAEVLRHVITAHPQPIAREELSERTGYKRSTRDLNLQRLRSRELIEEAGPGLVRASPTLF